MVGGDMVMVEYGGWQRRCGVELVGMEQGEESGSGGERRCLSRSMGKLHYSLDKVVSVAPLQDPTMSTITAILIGTQSVCSTAVRIGKRLQCQYSNNLNEIRCSMRH
ncbi:hypothetical protein Tco_0173006 [Tanacetum coccineum]